MHVPIVLFVFALVTFGVFGLAGWIAFGPRSHALKDPGDMDQAEPKSAKQTTVQVIMTFVVMSSLLAVVWLVSRADLGVSALGIALVVLGVHIVAKPFVIVTATLAERSPRIDTAVRHGLAAAVVLPAYFVRNWLTVDLCAAAVAVGVLVSARTVGLKTLVGLLIGIALFDLVAVFVTGMMIDVAERVMAPGRELPMAFSVPMRPSLDSPRAFMLGVGDVVLPGLLVMIGFRVARRYDAPALAIGPLVGYAAGLVTTIAVLLVSGAGQPATIYLVPLTFAGLLLTAWAKGLYKEIFRSESQNDAVRRRRAHFRFPRNASSQ